MKFIDKIAEYPVATFLCLLVIVYSSTFMYGFVENIDLSIVDSHINGQGSSEYAKLGFKPLIGDLINKVNVNFSKYDSFQYHLVSFLIFALQGFVVFTLFKTLFPANKKLILAATLLFVVNPVLIQQVTWLPARMYAIHGIFVFLAMIFAIKFQKEDNILHLVMFGLMGMLAGLSITHDFFTIPVIAIAMYFLLKDNIKFIKLLAVSLGAVLVAYLINWFAGYNPPIDFQVDKLGTSILLLFDVSNRFVFSIGSVVSKINSYAVGFSIIIVLSALVRVYQKKISGEYILFGIIFYLLSSLFLISRILFFPNQYFYDSMAGISLIAFMIFIIDFAVNTKKGLKSELIVLILIASLVLQIFVFSKDYKDPQSYFENIVKNHPSDNSARMTLASIYLSKNDVVKAISWYKVLYKTDSTNPKYAYQLGKIYFTQKKWDEAEYYFKRVKQLQDSPEIDNLILEIYKARGDFDSLLEKIRPLDSQIDSVNTYTIQLMDSYISVSRYDSAVAIGARKIRNQSDKNRIVKHLENLSKEYFKNGDNVKVIRTVEVAFSLDPNNKSIVQYLYESYNKAGVANKAKFFQDRLNKLNGNKN